MDKGIRMIKGLVISYMMTGGFLLILALLLFRFALSEKVVSIGIIIIYIAASFLAGIYSGKYMEHRRFLWGALSGCFYFVILLGVSLIADKEQENLLQQGVTVFLLCTGSGMIGGMVA